MASLLRKIVASKLIEKTKRKFIAKSGIFFSIKKLSPSSSDEVALVKILHTYGFTRVLDIGANIGQFAEGLCDFGFKGKIVSFEPTAVVYTKLQGTAGKFENWQVAEKMAIGNTCGEIAIHISTDPLFNSIKTIEKEYETYNAAAGSSQTENVKIATLDSVWDNYVDATDRVFLKIDTQGFEQEVLEGASASLEKVDGVKIEMPLSAIYQNVEWTMLDILNYLNEKGFSCVGISKVAVNQVTGVVHEVDGVFLRKTLLTKKEKA
jgi:FkbM family methyltransferase